MTELKTMLFGMMIAILACGLLSSCSKTKSELVSTKDMYFTMALIEPNATTVKCYVRITEDSSQWGNSVELAGNDELFCNDQKMGKQEAIGDYIYYTTRVHYTPQKPITITFKRGDNRYDSTNYVPDQVQLTSPTSLDLHFDDELDVTWVKSLNPKDKMSVSLSAVIPDNENQVSIISKASQSPESGAVKLKSLKSQTVLGLNQTAEVTLYLARKSEGVMSSELSGHFDSPIRSVNIKGTLRP